MSAADGRVHGLRPVKLSGPPAKRWNLVITADGYTAAQLPQFKSDADDLARHLFATPPFNHNPALNAINVYRVDVESHQSGADKPACQSGGGAGASVNTFFDSTFCYDGRIERLLYGNAVLAEQVVESLLPEWHQIIVLVNEPDYGGAGGAVAWLSNGQSDWLDVALHELGHSAFGLADEYDSDGPAQIASIEPKEINVTVEPDPSRVKWRALVDAPAGVPSRRNPNCRRTDPGPSPFGAETIGTFEGAKYMHCGFYRPAFDCKMKRTTAPFCNVCRHQIAKVMTPFGGRPVLSGMIARFGLRWRRNLYRRRSNKMGSTR